MINVRSTYYRTVEFVSPLTSATSTEYTLNIYIWEGLLSAVPASATYSLTRKNYTSSTGSEDVEIGRIVKSYFDLLYTGLSGGGDYTSQNVGGQFWVKTDVVYTTANPSDDGVKQDTEITIALYGYGYGNEGKNPQIPANEILITNTIFKVSRNTLFSIPVYTNTSKDVVITTPNSTYSNSYTIPSTTDTEEIIQLIKLDTSIISEIEDRVTITIDTIPYTILLDNDVRYTNTDLYFYNKHGAQQTVSMRKERSENMNVSKETYERSYNQPSDGYHQIVDFNVNGKTTISLNSGYIPEQNNLTFKELMLSDKVWMNYNNEIIPVKITSSNIDYKTREVDKLINYQLTIEHAYNEINTI